MERIIVIKFENAPGGGTYIVAKSAIEMLQEKYPDKEIIVVYIENKLLYWINNDDKKVVANLKNIPPFLQPFFECYYLRDLIRNNDLILALQGTTFLLPRKNKKICYVHHSNAFRYYDDARWKKFPFNILNLIFAIIILILEFIQRPDELIVNSKYTLKRNFHLRAKGEKRIIYPPVPLSKKDFPETKKDFPITSLGRIHPEKNHKLQLKVAKDFPDITFNIIGFCPPSQYSRWFEEEVKNYKNIQTSYNLTDIQIENKFSETKFYIHTMIGEHFGIAIAQAAMQGCILIISSKGGGIEISPEHSITYSNYKELYSIFDRIKKGETFVSPKKDSIDILRTKFSEQRFCEELFGIVDKYR